MVPAPSMTPPVASFSASAMSTGVQLMPSGAPNRCTMAATQYTPMSISDPLAMRASKMFVCLPARTSS